MNNGTTMKSAFIPIVSMAMLLLCPFFGSGAPPTTRQQTILPVAIPDGTLPVAPSNVPMYAVYGYSAWQVGAGTNEGRKFDLMPAGYAGANNTARLLTFFSMSDIHITDKESPAEVPYLGWSADFLDDGLGGLNHAAYSPVMFATTFRLDAAVRTINALHQVTPFDFGISLGDDANCSQYNELRWFIDVMDGQYITPSSGAHLGATTIDYQMPFQAAGLNRAIPWYDTIGNHDQMWMGVGYPATAKLQAAFIGTNVLNISTNGPLIPPGSEGVGMYVGVVDGTTPYGAVIKWGLTNLYATPPTVAADVNRHSLSEDLSSPTNYINEFFNTASFPVGHGFNLATTTTGSLAACYTFEPLTNLPIKMIVLDDTCKSNKLDQIPTFYGSGWIDAARLAWLTNELQKGQDADQLMIIACHIPILPQMGLFNTNRTTMFYDTQSESNLVATLHNYPNLLLVMAGHRHVNVVTPFPSPDPAHPENGFWEVETSSLRDFPQQFRTWEIRRNGDNSISILVTDVDPQVETNTPAWKSLGYGVGAERIFGNITLTDTSSHAYNAELVKKLTPAMQAKIAHYGTPIYYGGRDYDGDGKADPAAYQDGQVIVAFSGSGYSLFGTAIGGSGDIECSADFDGDCKTDPAIYNPTSRLLSVLFSARSYAPGGMTNMGGPGCVPVIGDFDGDHKSDPAVYSAAAGQLIVWMSNSGYSPRGVSLGRAGWLDAAADYDGDGLTDPAVMETATGIWEMLLSGNGYSPYGWRTRGRASIVPVAADYDGDGKADFMFYQTSDGLWQCTFSSLGYATTGEIGGLGGPTMVARAGDYDGDGKTDLAVYDPVTRFFYVALSGAGYRLAGISL
ncbi:MAG: TIGR03768 family metallophosphoesterase [Kiritimatiellae bacterium]|nr:TIGR03768 family metallophosphoesterase [Kiritimatiellia bacterium]